MGQIPIPQHSPTPKCAFDRDFPLSDIRRGTRVPCNLPVRLTNVDGFSGKAVVILVNPHGCAVKFTRGEEAGTTVLIEGLPDGRIATARVVTCILLEGGLWILGLALDMPGNVWGIKSPPDDWKDHLARHYCADRRERASILLLSPPLGRTCRINGNVYRFPDTRSEPIIQFIGSCGNRTPSHFPGIPSRGSAVPR